MKAILNHDKIRYHTNIRDGIVTAYISGDDAEYMLKEYFNSVSLNNDDLIDYMCSTRIPRIKDKYFGIATCHPDDNFNEDEGRSLARRRLKQDLYRDLREALRDMVRKEQRTIKILETLIDETVV